MATDELTTSASDSTAKNSGEYTVVELVVLTHWPTAVLSSHGESCQRPLPLSQLVLASVLLIVSSLPPPCANETPLSRWVVAQLLLQTCEHAGSTLLVPFNRPQTNRVSHYVWSFCPYDWLVL